jgi:succinate dehydrogenase / fumarate reductase, iron-sulfur subunit
MSQSERQRRVVRVFRYDPTEGGKGCFDRFELEVEDPASTTILDVLLRIQREQDPSLAFRYACRVNMCGSCGTVINGKEGLACKTNVSDLPREREITIRPLNHFPVIKDLVVDMEPFFRKFEEAMPFFHAGEEATEPAIIRPDSPERRAIGLSTECIACGCCVSACTMVNCHDDYAGPAALNRAFTLLLDSRDGLYDQRMDRVLGSCYNCRTEFNCTEVCPKEISSTRAIKYIQRLALKQILGSGGKPRSVEGRDRVPAPGPPPGPRETAPPVLEGPEDAARRTFLKRVTFGLGTAAALCLGGIAASAAIGPALRKKPAQWVRVESMEKLPAGRVATVYARHEVRDGFYRQEMVRPVMVWRRPDVNSLVVYNATCTHLGCTVHWDERKGLFLCACHGGTFDIDGIVKAGPPPRPLDRYRFKVESGTLFVEMA